MREEEEAKRVHQNIGSRVRIGVKVADMLSGREERAKRMREAKSLDSFQ